MSNKYSNKSSNKYSNKSIQTLSNKSIRCRSGHEKNSYIIISDHQAAFLGARFFFESRDFDRDLDLDLVLFFAPMAAKSTGAFAFLAFLLREADLDRDFDLREADFDRDLDLREADFDRDLDLATLGTPPLLALLLLDLRAAAPTKFFFLLLLLLSLLSLSMFSIREDICYNYVIVYQVITLSFSLND